MYKAMNNFSSGEIFVKVVDFVVRNEERLARKSLPRRTN